MDRTRQEELDERLEKACEELDAKGVRDALAAGANANCSCDNYVWWWFCCINRALESANHGDANDFDNAYEIVELLLKNGANPNKAIIEDDGKSLFTPLYSAFDLCPDTRICKLLLDHGADVNLPHNDEQWPLFDLVYQDWAYIPQDHDQDPDETQEQAFRRNGLLYFDKSELLLEHSAKIYDMLHTEYAWEGMDEDECKFLEACGNLDIANIKRLLKDNKALIDTKDRREDHYGYYAVRWASHNCRCETIGHRELFEQRVIDLLDYLTSQDKNPYKKLDEAFSQAMYYGYPSIIEWTMGRLESIDRETFAEEKMKLAKCYQRNWRHVFPDDIRSKIESLLL